MNTMYFDKRKSGLSSIDDLPWGVHFCQFYQTKEDILDILLPYFRAGLENNELCLWVTAGPINATEAKEALRKAVPDFKECARRGQIEIISHLRWRAGEKMPGGNLLARLDKAIAGGFDGLRLSCQAVPVRKGSKSFTCPEAAALDSSNIIAAFTYPRDKFDALGLMEVVKNHRFALVRNADRWEVIESSEVRIIKDALRKSEEKLHALFSNMSEGFAYHRIVLDAEGKPCDYVFLEINEAFEKLTGLKGKEVIGKRVTEVLPGVEKDPTAWIEKYGRVALTGNPIQFESYSEPLYRWYAVSAFSPHQGFFAVTFSDVTERKQAEADLKERTAQLEDSNKEHEAFTYSVSHDLRAPLRAIDGYSKIIEEDYRAQLDEKGKRMLQVIRKNTRNMGQLIDDLLAFSRLGRQKINAVELDMKSLAESAYEEITASLPPGRIITFNIKQLPPARGDKVLIRQVLVNLLSNAVKFTQRQAAAIIELGGSAAGGEHVYYVKDNGAGFDIRYVEKLFGVFQRLHGMEEFEGTGVGLAIVKRTVLKHGGRVWAEGKINQGATIYFTLPIG